MLAMLGLAALGIAWAWDATSGVAMDENGWIALGFGTFFSLAIGWGLMALMFFSSRRGYDEAAAPRIKAPNAAEAKSLFISLVSSGF